MSVARGLEKRLEKLIEGVAGRIFSGRLHPSELAGRLAREADFARFDHPSGPATANLFVIGVNPKDLTMDAGELAAMLTEEMTSYTAEEGLRLEGPVTVRIEADETTPSGRAVCHVEVVPGPPVVWAQLTAGHEIIDIGRNRAIVGRSPDCDTTVSHDDISRRHALVFRELGQSWIVDLKSANGTTVDGQRVGSEPVPLQHGSTVTMGEHRYRFREV
ncbi:MAG TPA: FhaA domain-containing protein [Acidimicrobiia bacterium]|nr:FhaA domain-containing protein [Acidimicrobiia bacterium]